MLRPVATDSFVTKEQWHNIYKTPDGLNGPIMFRNISISITENVTIAEYTTEPHISTHNRSPTYEWRFSLRLLTSQIAPTLPFQIIKDDSDDIVVRLVIRDHYIPIDVKFVSLVRDVSGEA
jgi:hypothetical protein